jgi:hypothetical protein
VRIAVAAEQGCPFPGGPSVVERVTRIELALSAWEVERLWLPEALTSQVSWPPVAVTAPWSPWLMAC